MAVVKIDRHFSNAPIDILCVSGDVKPVDSSIKAGSWALETDTKDVYIYNGTTWIMMYNMG